MIFELILALGVSAPAALAPPAPAQAPAEAEQPASVSLSMQQAVETALARSYRVQRSNRNEQIAERRVDVARAQNRPRLEVGLGAGQNQSYYDFRGNAFSFNRAEPQFYADAHASASLPLDISGVTRRQIRQSQYSHESSKLDREQAALDVSTDVRAAYTTSLRSQETVRADEEYLARIDAVLAQARTRQPSVVPFLETERSNALQTLQSSRTTADLSMQSLRLLLHVPRSTRLVLTTELPSAPAQLPATDALLELATRNRVDLRQSEIRLQQARLAAVQASDSRRPRLGITGYGSQRLNDELPNFRNFDGRTRSAGVVITGSIPIFVVDGGQLKNQRRITEIQAEQALADREEATERAENEINQVMIGLTSAQQRLRSLPDVEQALEALSRVENLMLAAPANDAPGFVAQVTNARQNWRSAVVSRNDVLTDFYGSYYRLQRSVGIEDIGILRASNSPPVVPDSRK
jgi:outer membrane protein TolC